MPSITAIDSPVQSRNHKKVFEQEEFLTYLFTALRWYTTAMALKDLHTNIQKKDLGGISTSSILLLSPLLDIKQYVEKKYTIKMPASSIIDTVGNSILSTYALYLLAMLGVSAVTGSWNLAHRLLM